MLGGDSQDTGQMVGGRVCGSEPSHDTLHNTFRVLSAPSPPRITDVRSQELCDAADVHSEGGHGVALLDWWLLPGDQDMALGRGRLLQPGQKRKR